LHKYRNSNQFEPARDRHSTGESERGSSRRAGRHDVRHAGPRARANSNVSLATLDGYRPLHMTLFSTSALVLAGLLRALQETPVLEPAAPQLDERPARSITAVPS
jgi:hypothetical protein